MSVSKEIPKPNPRVGEPWECYAEGDTVVTIFRGVTHRRQMKGNTLRTAEEQALARVASNIAKRAKKESRRFKPMLAQTYDPVKAFADGPVLIQPKLDGVRCLAYWHDGIIRLQSRGGDPYDVRHIVKALMGKYTGPGGKGPLGNGTVLDGELYVHGKSLQEIVSLVKRPREASEALEYWVYDIATTKPGGWAKRTGLQIGSGKTRIMPGQVGLIDGVVGGPIRRVRTVQVDSDDQIQHQNSLNLALEYEGSIIRPVNADYQFGKRSWAVQKLKQWKDEEFLIVGWKIGAGSAIGCPIYRCEDLDGTRFDVMPMGSKTHRAQLLKEARGGKCEGKMLTVKYFQLTDGGVPQFPVGLGIREEGM